jgi:hypothetical protein
MDHSRGKLTGVKGSVTLIKQICDGRFPPFPYASRTWLERTVMVVLVALRMLSLAQNSKHAFWDGPSVGERLSRRAWIDTYSLLATIVLVVLLWQGTRSYP